MKNNFKENGNLRIRFETAEERAEIIRILRRKGFRVSKVLKLAEEKEIGQWDTRTFDINLQRRSLYYNLRPMIGAAMISNGVRFYSAQEFFRLAELKFQTVPRFPVFHIPHDGNQFPEELMTGVCVSKQRFMRYHERMRDVHMSQTVPRAYYGGDMCARFEVSRLLCDVERFIGPEEVMEQYGMGFCYEKAYDGTVIKRVDEALKKRTLQYYWEHHARMDRIMERHPRVLLFDLHSFSDEIVPGDFLRPGERTPDLCLGTDERYTPPALTEIVRKHFGAAGFSIAENQPYSGCFVPNVIWSGKSDCDCASVMLEINRRWYCDGEGKPIPERLATIRRIIGEMMADCITL